MRLKVQSVEIQDAPFRAPFKFGAAIVTELRVPHVSVELTTGTGTATGVGAMPLANAWSYPGPEYGRTLATMELLLDAIHKRLADIELPDDPFEVSAIIRGIAIDEAGVLNREATLESPIPDLCSLVTASPFDLAFFDAWGKAHGANTYQLLRERQAPATAGLGSRFNAAPLAGVLSENP
jgi:L-alanine-DL-glutamate epimerase-like enolase superfamily enzyme